MTSSLHGGGDWFATQNSASKMVYWEVWAMPLPGLLPRHYGKKRSGTAGSIVTLFSDEVARIRDSQINVDPFLERIRSKLSEG